MGSAVTQTLLEQCDILNKRFGINMQIRGIANSRTMMLSNDLAVMMKGQCHALSYVFMYGLFPHK